MRWWLACALSLVGLSCFAAETDPYKDWLRFTRESSNDAGSATGYYAMQDVAQMHAGETVYLPPAVHNADSRWSRTPGGHDVVVIRRDRDDRMSLSGPGIPSIDLTQAKDRRLRLKSGLIVAAAMPHNGIIKAVLYNPELPAKRAFRGLDYFPYAAAGVVKGAFRRKAAPVGVNYLDSRKQNGLMYWIGDVETSIAGKPYRLRAFSYEHEWSKIDVMLILLRDGTSGKTSYGGGRVLDIGFPKGAPPNDVTMNFNMLYSFLCAHSSFYNCPLDLTDRVDSELRYGEKYPALVSADTATAAH